MQKSGQNFSKRSKTILFLQRVRLSKHGFFIFNVTHFENSYFLTRKCQKLFLWALLNWSLFGDRFGHVSRFISKQTRLQKITILLFLMPYIGARNACWNTVKSPCWEDTKKRQNAIFCKRVCSLINREACPNRSPKSDQFKSAHRNSFWHFRVKNSCFQNVLH